VYIALYEVDIIGQLTLKIGFYFGINISLRHRAHYAGKIFENGVFRHPESTNVSR